MLAPTCFATNDKAKKTQMNSLSFLIPISVLLQHSVCAKFLFRLMLFVRVKQQIVIITTQLDDDGDDGRESSMRCHASPLFSNFRRAITSYQVILSVNAIVFFLPLLLGTLMDSSQVESNGT